MKNTSKNLAALILALVLTLSLALSAPAASAASADLAATSAQSDNIDKPQPIAFGKPETATLKEGQTAFYSFTLTDPSVVALRPSFSCEDGHSFSFDILKASDLTKVTGKIIYARYPETVDFYLPRDNYILSVCKNSGYDIDAVTTRLNYHQIGGLKASATTNSVTLKWNTDANADGYQVYAYSQGSWKLRKTLSGVTCTFGSLTRGNTYKFSVRPYYIKNAAKYYGSRVAITAKTPKSVAAPNLPVLKNTKSGVRITYSRVAGAAKYRIFRKTGNGSWKKLVDTNSAYVDKTAKNGVTYRYTIRCITADSRQFTSDFNRTGRVIKCKR